MKLNDPELKTKASFSASSETSNVLLHVLHVLTHCMVLMQCKIGPLLA